MLDSSRPGVRNAFVFRQSFVATAGRTPSAGHAALSGEAFSWRTESDAPAPTQLVPVDDRLRADAALSRLRRGDTLLYTGDWNNAKQLLTALGRRVSSPSKARSPLEAFRAERQARQLEQKTLSNVVVALDGDYRLQLARAPDVAIACRQVWGEPQSGRTLVPLKTLLGMLGAAEWRRKGLVVPGLKGLLHPHYGVYLPTRTDYVELLGRVSDVKGKRIFDLGTGTGVLSLLLLQKGAKEALATDIDPRAVACAKENAERLGLANRFQVSEGNLFPAGKADWVVCNPPWIPEPPKNRMDRAVFDEDGEMLRGFLEGLPRHLSPSGQGLLILSDLAVLLGLHSPDWLAEQFSENKLRVAWTQSTPARHGKAKDASDPLFTARSQEVISLYGLVPI